MMLDPQEKEVANPLSPFATQSAADAHPLGSAGGSKGIAKPPLGGLIGPSVLVSSPENVQSCSLNEHHKASLDLRTYTSCSPVRRTLSLLCYSVSQETSGVRCTILLYVKYRPDLKYTRAQALLRIAMPGYDQGCFPHWGTV